MQDNPYDRFRRNHSVKDNCSRNKTSTFIENHISSTTIFVDRTEEEIPAVLVMTDAEGADNSLLYVYDEADIESGDYFTWKEDYHFFILENVIIIHDVDFKKFNTLLCNVKVNDSIWAFFKGNMRSFKDTTLKGGNFEESTLAPLLIVPQSQNLKINSYVTINNQVWRIVDADLDTISNIGYYYVERDLNPRDLEAEIEEMEEAGTLETSNLIYLGQVVEIPTKNGHFSTNLKVKLIKKSANLITFTPEEEGLLQVTFSDVDGVEKTTEYIVKEV